MAEIEHRVHSLEKSDADKETRLRSVETTQAINSERYIAISNRLDRIDSHTAWLVRLLVGAIILGIISWVFTRGEVVGWMT